MKPAITITEKSIRVSTDAFELTLEFRQSGTSVEKLRQSYKSLDDSIEEHVSNPYPIEKDQKVIYNIGAKSARTYKPRECEFCGSTFTPTGATHRFCSDKCKALSKRKKPLSEMEEAELDKTLKEIEERQKHYTL